MRSAAVVCAFGPPATTRLAVQRARKLVGGDGQVVVIAGNRAGTRAVASVAPSRGVQVSDGVGTAALRAALEAVTDGPVLVLHDDVLLPPPALRALSAEHAAGSGPVVPWTNDPGSDHYLGALPPVRAGVSALQRHVATRPGAAWANQIRPVCLYGTAVELLALLDENPIAPGMLLQRPLDPLRVAAGAIASHDAACTEQLVEPRGPEGRPLLVATMIVRDEEAMLADCLRSLAPLVDRVEICDTGSVDGTVEVARAAGAHVIQREWRDDFAWARNEVLEQARDAWFVLQIDADERVVCDDPVRLRRRLATGLDDHRTFQLRITNLRQTGEAASAFTAARLFSPAGARYRGRLHETPEYPDEQTAAAQWPVLRHLELSHLGYTEQMMVDRDKMSRNVAISKAEYEAAPTAQTALNYARSLFGSDLPLERRLYAEALESRDQLSLPGQAMILSALSEIALQLGDTQESLDRAAEALELVPSDDRAMTAYGHAAEALGRPELVLEMSERRRGSSSLPQHLEASQLHASASSREITALAAVGRVDEAVELAAQVLRDGTYGFDAWEPLALGVIAFDSPDRLGERLVPLLLADPEGGAFGVLARSIPPRLSAQLCLSYLQAGGPNVLGLRVGMLAALVSNRHDVVDALVVYRAMADGEVAAQLAGAASQAGRPDVAATLLSPVPVGA